MSATEATSSLHEANTARLFLTRGLVAIAWAAIFAGASHSLTTAVTVGAGVLLVLYPLIDVAASLIDARSQRGTARQLLLADAGRSTSSVTCRVTDGWRCRGDRGSMSPRGKRPPPGRCAG